MVLVQRFLFKIIFKKRRKKVTKWFDSPDTASRRVVVQNSVAVKPLHDTVLHLHCYVAHNA